METKRKFHSVFSVFYPNATPVFFSPSNYSFSCMVLFVVLLPVYALLAGIFGIKVLLLLFLSIVFGFLTEFISVRITRSFTGYYGVPAWLLFPLMVPPGMELWMSIVCLILALIITVVLFGGFGYHLFHPAPVAQVFVMINFGGPFVTSFTRPFISPYYGFQVYQALLPAKQTTLVSLKSGAAMDAGRLLLGPNIGFYSDALPVVVICAGLVYLLLGSVNRKTPMAFGITMIAGSWLFSLLFPGMFLPPIQSLLGGSALFYIFFISSDRWTSAKSNPGRIFAGVFAGLLLILLRAFASNIEATMFVALLVTTFVPLLDEAGFSLKRKWQERRA